MLRNLRAPAPHRLPQPLPAPGIPRLRTPPPHLRRILRIMDMDTETTPVITDRNLLSHPISLSRIQRKLTAPLSSMRRRRKLALPHNKPRRVAPLPLEYPFSPSHSVCWSSPSSGASRSEGNLISTNEPQVAT
jgi:hypothetical protein